MLAGEPHKGLRILNLSFGQDTGGQQWRLSQAWPRYRPQDRYLSITRTKTFYPVQHSFHRSSVPVRWAESDVVHLHGDLHYRKRLRVPDKPMVMNHHGSQFRTRPDYHLQELRKTRAVAIASTVDLHAISPAEVTWLPQAFDLAELQKYRDPQPDDGILRIAHAPTNRAIKGTTALEQTVLKLQRLGAPVTLDIIEGVSNKECLKRKGRADLFVDQFLLGYGNNAIEAWGMGLPVLAGVQPEKCMPLIRQQIPEETPQIMQELWDGYPFYFTTEETLTDSILQMVNPETRQKWADRGMQHFLRFHEASVVVDRLSALYQEAIDQWQS